MNSEAESAREDAFPPPPSSMVTTTTPQASSIEQQPSYTNIFESLRAYPFETDQEFASGLAIILGHSETPASEEEISRDDELVLQAKCYYFARKINIVSPIVVADYKSWLEARTASNNFVNQLRVTETPEYEPSKTVSLSHASTYPEQQPTRPLSQEPAYPTSFAHIVELITTGQPVPGIQQVPDTLLTGQGAASAKSKRRKPWEKEESTVVSIDRAS
ncbi:hypothetical protein BJX64DRAFT_290868 [Aspergillus heterothallicus]